MRFVEAREAYVLDLRGKDVDVSEDGQHWFHLSVVGARHARTKRSEKSGI